MFNIDINKKINKQKKFKILSIDGGGVKALYSMYILDEYERKYCIPNGKLLSDYFQMICGTSAGSMVATAVALKIPMSVLINTFESNVEKIFPVSSKKSYLWSFIETAYNTINQLRGDKYSSNPLKDVLEDLYKDKTMKDVYNLLCIPSFCVNKSQVHIFKNDNSHNIKLVDMVLASAAAPTYFSPYKINDNYYIDGGVWANDPSFVGIIESLKCYVGNSKEYDSYSLLSIGNLLEKINYNITNPSSFFNVEHVPELISILITANISSAEYFIKKFEDDKIGNHIRIEHKEIEEYSLDDSSPEFLKQLKEWGQNDYEKYEDDVEFFFNK